LGAAFFLAAFFAVAIFLEFKLVSKTIYTHKNRNFFGSSKNFFEKSKKFSKHLPRLR
jgi:hypothetical protein